LKEGVRSKPSFRESQDFDVLVQYEFFDFGGFVKMRSNRGGGADIKMSKLDGGRWAWIKMDVPRKQQ
jgi:hypothetical protein